MRNLSSPTIARRIINNSSSLLILLFLLSMLSSCYHKADKKNEAMVQLSEHQIDSLSFFSQHHYTNNYNFVVKQDSVVLYSQQPEEILSTGMEVDSFAAYKHDMLAVAEIRIIPTDSIDSVWVELATEDSRFGWTRESQFLNKVVPDDPISQFISIFSDVHLIIFLVVIGIIVISYWIRHMPISRLSILRCGVISIIIPLSTPLVFHSNCLYSCA